MPLEKDVFEKNIPCCNDKGKNWGEEDFEFLPWTLELQAIQQFSQNPARLS